MKINLNFLFFYTEIELINDQLIFLVNIFMRWIKKKFYIFMPFCFNNAISCRLNKNLKKIWNIVILSYLN